MIEYAVKRDEMLMKRSVDEFRKFVKENKKHYGFSLASFILASCDAVLEITLHKMIVHSTNLPFDFRQESADWLLNNGYDLDL